MNLYKPTCLIQAGSTVMLGATAILDFIKGLYADNRSSLSEPSAIILTRPSQAVFWASGGNLEVVPADVARIEFNPLTGQRDGLLLEGRRSNDIVQSHSFEVDWSLSGVAVQAGHDDLFGGTTCQRLTADNNVSGNAVTMAIGPFIGFEPITDHVIVEAGSGAQIAFGTFSGGADGWMQLAEFDFSTRVISVASASAGDDVSAKATRLKSVGPNGGALYRLEVTGTPSNPDDQREFVLYPTGRDQNAHHVYLHHVQSEVGQGASSPIRTSGAAEVREADIALLDLTDRAGWSAASLVCEYKASGPSPAPIFRATDGGAQNAISWGPVGSERLALVLDDEERYYYAAAGLDQDRVHNVGIALENGSGALALNGEIVDQIAEVAAPRISQIFFGSEAGFFGHLRAVNYTPGRLSDADLISRTTPTIISRNIVPAAVDDTGIATPFETPVDIDVLANDIDVDDDALSLTGTPTATSGTVAYVGGLLRFTPATGFEGAVTLTYEITDGEATDTGSVSVTVEEEAPSGPVPFATTPRQMPIIIHEASQSRFRVVDQGAMGATTSLRFEWFKNDVLFSGNPTYVAPDTGVIAGDVIRLDLYYANANGESLQQSNVLVYGGRDFADIGQTLVNINAGTITGGYVVGGDSTRNWATNRMTQHYYPTQLAKIHPTGMAFVNNALGGQSTADWANDVDSPNVGDLAGDIAGTGSGWLYELSLGLNDFTGNTPAVRAAMKSALETGLNRLHSLYPDMQVFLVTPIFTGNPDRNAMTQAVYAELAAERTLPLVDAFTGMQSVFDGGTANVFYEETTHPSSQGAALLTHIIFDAITPSALWSVVTIDEMHRVPGPGVPATPLTIEELIAGFTFNLAIDGPTNTAPVAVDDTGLTTPFETAIDIDVLANDTDADGDTLSLTGAPTATSGTVAYVGSLLRFTPATGFDGAVTLTYEVTDGEATDSGSVSVTVEEEEAAPNTLILNDATFTQVDADDDPDRLTLNVTYDGDAAIFAHVSILSSAVTPTSAQIDAETGNVVETEVFEITGADINLDLAFTNSAPANTNLSVQLREAGTDVTSAVLVRVNPSPIAGQVTITPINANPITLGSGGNENPKTVQIAAPSTGNAVFITSGYNFFAADGLDVTYNGVPLSTEVIFDANGQNYMAIHRGEGLPTSGTHEFAQTFTSGGTPLSSASGVHVVQAFETSAFAAQAARSVSNNAAGQLSLSGINVPDGGAIIAGGFQQLSGGSPGATWGGVAASGAAAVGSHYVATGALSAQTPAAPNTNVTLDFTSASGTRVMLLLALPLDPA